MPRMEPRQKTGEWVNQSALSETAKGANIQNTPRRREIDTMASTRSEQLADPISGVTFYHYIMPWLKHLFADFCSFISIGLLKFRHVLSCVIQVKN